MSYIHVSNGTMHYISSMHHTHSCWRRDSIESNGINQSLLCASSCRGWSTDELYITSPQYYLQPNSRRQALDGCIIVVVNLTSTNLPAPFYSNSLLCSSAVSFADSSFLLAFPADIRSEAETISLKKTRNSNSSGFLKYKSSAKFVS